MSASSRVVAIACLAVLGNACGPEPFAPDAEWDVTVTGVETDCTDDTSAGFQQTYTYQRLATGSNVELRIEGDVFATGLMAGCTLDYSTPTWIEERDGGDFRWILNGEADFNVYGTSACDVDEPYDWLGEEVITVVESENPDVPEGCTYTFEVFGTAKALQ